MKKTIITLIFLSSFSAFTSATASTNLGDDYKAGWDDGYSAGKKTCESKLYKCNVVYWSGGRQWKVSGTGSTKIEALAHAKKQCARDYCDDSHIACSEI